MANSPSLTWSRLALSIALACAAAPSLAANDAMLQLLDVLHKKGTIDDETYGALKIATQADEEQNGAAGADVSKKVGQALGELGTPTLTPGRFEVKDKTGDFGWRVGGRLMYDAAFFDNDGKFRQTDGSQVRRFRINVQGTLSTNWKFKAEYDFRELDTGIAGLKDAYFDYLGATAFGRPLDIKIGQSHEPFSFDLINSSNNSLFVERAMPVNALANFIGERNPGLKTTMLGETWTVAVGAFATKQQETVSPVTTTCTLPTTGALNGAKITCTGSGGQEDTPPRDFNDGYALTGRVTYSPWHDGGHVLHLGTGFSYRDFKDGNVLRLRERPEANETSLRMVDTGNFTANDFIRWNAEVAAVQGPFTFQGEYLMLKTNSTAAFGDPLFDGYYVSAGWFITGESRPYKFEDGVFDSVRPKSIVGRGGLGAWELVARFSSTDLTDAKVVGGEEDNFTVGLNWYPTPNIRFMMDYIKVLDVTGGAFAGAEPAAFVIRSNIFW